MTSLGMQSDHVEEQKKRRKTGGHTRDRRGCQICRQRKKKCDLDNIDGSCATCIRMNLRCEWEPLRSLNPLSIRSSKSAVSAIKPWDTSIVRIPNPEQFWVEAGSDNDSDGFIYERRAHAYYMSFAGLLTTNLQNNGFLDALLPLAAYGKTKLLTKTMSAWAMSHLALLDDNGETKRKAENLREKAFEDLVLSIRHDKESSEQHVASCLVFTSLHSIDGGVRNWDIHLKFAAELIKSTMKRSGPLGRWKSHLECSYEGKWLLRNFAYHDILAAVSLSQDLLLPQLVCYEEGEKGFADTYVGLATLPMIMLAKICIQAGHLREVSRFMEIEDNECSTVPAIYYKASCELDYVESCLRSWHPADAQDPSLVAQAETYRSAALIYLYRIRRDHPYIAGDMVRGNMQREVESVLFHAGEMTSGCLPECTLLFPLFLAGGEIHDHEQQKFVQKRMEEMSKHRYFRNVDTALQVLQEVWNERKKWPTMSYDWTDVLIKRNWKLSLS